MSNSKPADTTNGVSKLQKPRNGFVSEKGDLITALSAAPNPKVVIDLCGRDTDSAVENRTSDFRTNEKNSHSQNTPPENLVTVDVNAGENQSEVSPEICKSVSVKRFKFSPGMVIHFTHT